MKAVKRSNLSTRQLYATAVAACVRRHAAFRVTEALNTVYADPEVSRLDPAIAAAQVRDLARER